METPIAEIKRDLGVHRVFRTKSFIFRYDDMGVTVFHETLRWGTFVQTLMFVQGVNSLNDGAEFILAYLKKVGG